jgi:1,2-phenylacetyl-CoA epoxidase PaaB subunit
MVHLHGLRAVHVVAHDTQGRGGFPEVMPAPGEHARPYGVLRRKEREHVVEDVVRDGRGQRPAATSPRLPTPPLRGHSGESWQAISRRREPGVWIWKSGSAEISRRHPCHSRFSLSEQHAGCVRGSHAFGPSCSVLLQVVFGQGLKKPFAKNTHSPVVLLKIVKIEKII